MLQNIRDKMQGQRWLTYLVLGALALVFAAWGAYGFIGEGFGTTSYAAKVNGEDIPVAEVNEAWQRQQTQLLQTMGSLTDAQRAEYQQQLLDSSIRSLAMMQYARKAGFRVSDAQVAKAFHEEPAFQIDGKFDLLAARQRLLAAGITEQAYVNDLRKSLLTNQLMGVIGVSDFLTPAETQRILALLDEERELRFALLQPESFSAGVAVEPAQVEAWYKSHTEDYAVPESVKLAYAELTLADISASLVIADEQLRERYEKDKTSYQQPETRRASHILIAVDGETDDAKAAALAKEVYGKVRAGGDFAALAKQYSKDTASAEKGGDLDWAGRDVYVKEFSDKLFAMKQGEVSEPVKTQFGYHIIRLDGVREATGRSFDEVKGEIATALRNELAQTQFTTRQDRLQERLERGASNLEALAQEFGMRRGEVAQFERGVGGLPLGSDAELNRAVFSDASLNQKRVGGPVQLGEDRMTIFQVQEHRPAAVKPLEEVRGAITVELVRQRGAEAALKAAEAAVASLAAGKTFDQVAAGLKVKAEPARFVGRGSPDLPVELRDAVFAAARPAPGKPVRQALKLEGGQVALFEVVSSRVQSMSDNPMLQQLRSQRELQRYSQREIESYMADVVSGARVRRNPQAFQ